MLRTLGWLVALVGCSLFAPVAQAHINLKSPAKRAGGDIKIGPCTGVARGASPTVLEPGATITVTWDETVQHPGHYRIAFDADGEDFAPLTGFDDIKAPLPFDLGNGAVVLADDIMDKTGPIFGNTPYELMVTLPDVECETCTLQLIQVMIDKDPYVANTDDIYHECADIALRRTTPPDAGVLPTPDAGLPPPAGGTVAPPPPPVAGMVAPPPVAGTTAGAMGAAGMGFTGGALAPLPPTTSSGGDEGGCSVAHGRTSDAALPITSALLLLSRRRRRDTRVTTA